MVDISRHGPGITVGGCGVLVMSATVCSEFAMVPWFRRRVDVGEHYLDYCKSRVVFKYSVWNMEYGMRCGTTPAGRIGSASASGMCPIATTIQGTLPRTEYGVSDTAQLSGLLRSITIKVLAINLNAGMVGDNNSPWHAMRCEFLQGTKFAEQSRQHPLMAIAYHFPLSFPASAARGGNTPLSIGDHCFGNCQPRGYGIKWLRSIPGGPYRAFSSNLGIGRGQIQHGVKAGILTAKPVNLDESRRLQTLSRVEKLGTNQVHLRCHRRCWQSQASGPVTTGRRRPLGRDRIGGFVWSKREREPLQPIAALVTKVLDDEPTMAEDWP
ncbi:hypothetical protein PCH_Pc18g04890 [Penicillium rubens Wisconsin 54-1255]|uniref:Uncharacterized protein n=1 Tax=Penicillium rubens (strain ATCC 28089 / DSM 1075 / NRRL 1951 / Wisconsin 54-1255) TaxID=500485 RepID=B6HBW1_PENRW|nr:hypothetical protein PCH_Pc18g04890 [Penicillium rubens Wisconsin 54-1255]